MGLEEQSCAASSDEDGCVLQQKGGSCMPHGSALDSAAGF